MSRRGLQLSVLGFPVRIDPIFLVAAFVLGPRDVGFDAIAVWIGVLLVSILVHELGHAVAARGCGHEARIELYGFGGLTHHSGPRLSRGRNVLISVAGPACGIAVGAALRAATHADTALGLGGYALRAAIFVNLWWGLVNLLPVLPLDGGRVLVELLPGADATRLRTAQAVSVVTGVAAAGVALRLGYTYAALLAGFFALSNALALRRRTARVPPPAGGADPVRLGLSVLDLVQQGHPDRARHLLDTSPAGAFVDPALRGLVVALTGEPAAGRALVEAAIAERPDSELRRECLARLPA